jgi:hypothetical protein
MKYYKSPPGVASELFGNDFSYEEITEKNLTNLKKDSKLTC